ncbi:Putative Isoquinoline 1-oxidoreductase subunit protein [Minicystis rosea]|nr:Putative Isoquinoline 1-oxidoreductase subunit protein [Minicystis rosea]
MADVPSHTLSLKASMMTMGAMVLALAGMSCSAAAPAPSQAAVDPAALRGPEAFVQIADPAARSAALFLEASRVLLHPRCTNCHPSDDSPRQREGELHEPPVARGPEDRGPPGMPCSGCHQDKNLTTARVPGAPGWHLAPRSMAWVGKSPADLCAQIKDPGRNGNKTLPQIVEHAEHDPLVAWGWAPGADRAPAPGTQAQFGALIAAWVDTGAACPREEARR